MCLWTCVSESAKSAQSGMTPCDRTVRREQNLNSPTEQEWAKLGERVTVYSEKYEQLRGHVLRLFYKDYGVKPV